jgi:hypothetical protein
MTIRWGRIVIAAVAAEVLGVLSLVLLVALFGPSESAAAQAYAQRLGFWVGPISGFVFCLLGGLWVARGLTRGRVLNGVLVGVAGAGVDAGILAVMGDLVPFEPVFAVSLAGRVVAGTLGGWLAAHPAKAAAA